MESPEDVALPFVAYLNRRCALTNFALHQAIGINVPLGCGDTWRCGHAMRWWATKRAWWSYPPRRSYKSDAEAVAMMVFEGFVRDSP